MGEILHINEGADRAAVEAAILARYPGASLDVAAMPRDGGAVVALCPDGDGGASGDAQTLQRVEVAYRDGAWFLASDAAAEVFRPWAWLPLATLCPRASGRYGAPMGRHGGPAPNGDAPMVAARIPLDGGGYDPGGAYWGAPSDLWGVVDADGRLAYVRAPSSRAVLAMIAEGGI